MPRFDCVYTSQKTKKRKAYSDGYIVLDERSLRCTLHQVDAKYSALCSALDCRTFSIKEIQDISSGMLEEIEFENYFVVVEQPPPAASAANCAKPKNDIVGKRAKFTPPSHVVYVPPAPKLQEISQPRIPQQLNASCQPSFGSDNAYSVNDDELNNIWGTENETKKEEDPALPAPPKYPTTMDKKSVHNPVVYPCRDPGFVARQEQGDRNVNPTINANFRNIDSAASASVGDAAVSSRSVSLNGGVMVHSHSRRSFHVTTGPSSPAMLPISVLDKPDSGCVSTAVVDWGGGERSTSPNPARNIAHKEREPTDDDMWGSNSSYQTEAEVFEL